MSAEKVLDRMCDDMLISCWEAIKEGGLGESTTVNGVPPEHMD